MAVGNGNRRATNRIWLRQIDMMLEREHDFTGNITLHINDGHISKSKVDRTLDLLTISEQNTRYSAE